MLIYSWLAFISAVADLSIATFVLFNNFRRITNRIFFLLGIALTIWSIGFLGLCIATDQNLIDFWIKTFYIGLSFVPPLYYHFIVISTDNQKKLNRFFVFLGYWFSGFFVLLLTLGYISSGSTHFFQFYFPRAGRGYTLFALNYIFFTGYGTYLLLKKYRLSSSPLEKKQLFYIFIGVIIAVIGSVSNVLVAMGIKILPFGHLAIAFCMVLVSYGIVGYRLIDIHTVLRKGLVYSSFTGLLTAVFVVSILIFERLFRNLAGYTSLFPGIISASLITLIFQPLRDKIQEFIDRAFFRKRYHQEQELKRFSREVISILDKETLLYSTVYTIVQSLYIERGGILLGDEGNKKYSLKASIGWDGETNLSLEQSNVLVDCLERNRKEIFIDKIENSVHLSWVAATIWQQLKTIRITLCMPMVAKNKLLGILLLGGKSSGLPYTNDDLDLLSVLVDEASIALENANLYEDTKLHFFRTIQSLVTAVEAKDAYTRGHCERVAHYAVAIATALGMPSTTIEALKIGAFLHDIGKIGISERILLKATQLTEEEYKVIKEHPLIGTKILEPVLFGKEIIDIVKYHHEKIDGSGYPEGLRKEHIPLTARILAVADVFEALTSDRAYRKALTRESAIHIIQLGAGKHFDARVVTTFIQLIKEGLNLQILDFSVKNVYPDLPERFLNANNQS